MSQDKGFFYRSRPSCSTTFSRRLGGLLHVSFGLAFQFDLIGEMSSVIVRGTFHFSFVYVVEVEVRTIYHNIIMMMSGLRR